MRTLFLTARTALIGGTWLLGLLFLLPLHQLTDSWPVALIATTNASVLLSCLVLLLNSIERLQASPNNQNRQTRPNG